MSKINDLIKKLCRNGVEFKKLEDCCNILDNKRKPVSKGVRENGEYPYYGANGIQDYVSGYTHNGEYVLVAEDGANDLNIYPVQYVNGKVWVNNHAHVLQAKCEYGTNKFLRFAISNLNIKPYLVGCGRLKLNSEVLMTLGIKLPKLDSQIIISKYLYSQDDNIINTSKKIASLKQFKSACLIFMFPQQGETVPRVRFKGFDGEWNEQKAENIFRQFIEKNRPDLPVLSATQDRGMVTRKAIGYDISHDKRNECNYKHILPGQFVIHLRSFQGGFAHSDIEGIASPAYTVFEFRDKNQHNDIFWKYIFSSKSFIKQLEKITYGIRDGRSISFDEFKDMKFIIPCVKEQHQIASYFRNLDIQISEQEKRLEKLKQIKAACLDKMFV